VDGLARLKEVQLVELPEEASTDFTKPYAIREGGLIC
jgi:hypothetical protein